MDEAPVVLYVRNAEPPVVDRLDAVGQWRAETAWPPPRTQDRTLYLDEAGALGDEPGGAGVETYEYHAGVGVTAGLRERDERVAAEHREPGHVTR